MRVANARRIQESHMLLRSTCWSAVVVAAISPELLAAPAPIGDSNFKPTAVWRVKPPDDLLADVRYVAGLIGRFAPNEQEAKQFAGAADAALDNALGADWRKAVDTSKPL